MHTNLWVSFFEMIFCTQGCVYIHKLMKEKTKYFHRLFMKKIDGLLLVTLSG
ncbi:hypothetical protein BY454_11612 [Marinobacter persicus]|jgi:hypothetical protein|uniref:Uncharacterized protein n=1 Tax=Marinobacter persicus TaxID=930118 RepID=A0A2S6G3C2_9GAMM|nr:hypothetical protein BY455_11512 [Marinobacter persicus]PPK53134.1 hypothetical protein B0H24_102912 [Marinobacter persicus]PPK57736.1 hypothetical protein BY454_11612 [Marinobacter persicus]